MKKNGLQKELNKMQFNYVSSPFMRALIRKYEFQRDEAIANLNVYFSNSVGVGDHGSFLDEMDKWMSRLTDAEDKLKSLIGHFAQNPAQTTATAPTTEES